MLTVQSRDRLLKRLIDDFGCASSRQLATLYFKSLRRCQDRLAMLCREGYINRTRESINADYVYYTGKTPPKETAHMLMRVEAYIAISRLHRLSRFVPEFEIGDIRADAYFEIWRNGFILPYFLECQRTGRFHQEKYERFYQSGAWVDRWREFPGVVIVSDTRITLKDSPIKYIEFDGKAVI